MIPRRINMGDRYMCLTACLHTEKKCSQEAEESVLKEEGFFYRIYFT